MRQLITLLSIILITGFFVCSSIYWIRLGDGDVTTETVGVQLTPTEAKKAMGNKYMSDHDYYHTFTYEKTRTRAIFPLYKDSLVKLEEGLTLVGRH